MKCLPRIQIFKLKMIKVPDFAERSYGAKDNCRKQCLENCSCVAYAYDAGIGCLSWSGNLIDLQKFSCGGSYIYIFIWPIWNSVSSFCFQSHVLYNPIPKLLINQQQQLVQLLAYLVLFKKRNWINFNIFIYFRD